MVTVFEVELPIKMSIDLILQPLPNSFSQFIVNFNMNKMLISLLELLNMVTTTEGNLHKERPQVLVVGETSKKRKTISASKGGKGKKNIKVTPKRKHDNENDIYSIVAREDTRRGTLESTLVRKLKRSMVMLQVCRGGTHFINFVFEFEVKFSFLSLFFLYWQWLRFVNSCTQLLHLKEQFNG